MSDPRIERHGRFIASLGNRLLQGVRGKGAYTDGGPSLKRSDKKRRKAARTARRTNRA